MQETSGDDSPPSGEGSEEKRVQHPTSPASSQSIPLLSENEYGESSPISKEKGGGAQSTTPSSSRSLSPNYEKEKSVGKSYRDAILSTESLMEERILALEKQFEAFKKQYIFDIGTAQNPTTLRSDKLTPELIAIGSTFHFTDYGLMNRSINPGRWNYPFGYHTEIGHFFLASANVIVDRVQQLPEQRNVHGSRFPANIVFPSPSAREAAVHSLKNYCERSGIKNLPLHYSLTKNPILKHQIKGISTILKELKKERVITFYSLNNIMAVNTNEEKLAPIFSFQTPSMSKPSNFSNCPSNDFFFSGNIIPTNDKKFISEEYLLLKEIIRSSLKYDTPPEPVYDIYNMPADSSLLDIMVDNPGKSNYKSPRYHKHQSKGKSLSPPNIRSQSTPIHGPLQNHAYSADENYTSPPPPPSMWEAIKQSLHILDQGCPMPNKQNLSIPSPTSSENSTITSPNITPPILQQIEIHQKSYTNM